MPKYVLHYFAGNGRAIISRAILCYAKADWTNDAIKREDWPTIKKSGLCEFEQVPILEVDGKKYSQSNAITLYLAETFNLMGKDIEENYQIRSLLFAIDDYNIEIWKALFSQDEAKKPELLKAALEKFKFFVGKFEKRYVDLGKGKYFLGDKFTLADIIMACSISDASKMLKFEGVKEVAPNLYELINRVKENELKEFFEKFYVK
jgi:glutathione S-transferase